MPQASATRAHDTGWENARRALQERRQYDQVPFNQPLPIDGRWPDFMIIGAQKSGTTWLHQNLSHHPEIWLPPVKELHYFSIRYAPSKSGWERTSLADQITRAQRSPHMSGRSPEAIARLRGCLAHLQSMGDDDVWYRRVFAFAGSGQVTGETSTFYSVLPRQAISLIAQQNNTLRIILMLRDPIDRAWSHIRMHVHRGDPQAIALASNYCGQTLWAFVALSNYAEILNNWRAAIPTERLLILNFDDLAIRPKQLLGQTCDFLHVGYDGRFFPESDSQIHVGEAHEMPPALYAELKRSMQRIYDDLARCLPAMTAPWRARHFGSA